MDNLETVKSAVESMISADEILHNNGFCSVIHDSLNRKYLQAGGDFFKLLKSNKLAYTVSIKDSQYPIEIACDELKAYAMYRVQEAISLRIITRKKYLELCK